MGTAAWTNWQAFEAGAQEREHVEDELHSDTGFRGSPKIFGPYTLSIIFRHHQRADVCPALILRSGLHASLTPDILVDGQLVETNTKGYHGGILSDEIAALVALELGVRLRFAGTRLMSGIHHNDEPAGGPYLFDVPRATRPGTPDREILPNSLVRDANLDNLDLTTKFATVREEDQVQIIRAARSYADATWWANEDPNQAWLQLVTALEIAAKAQQSGSYDPQEVIEELDPELWSLLKDLNEDLRAKLAKRLAPQHRVTRTFIDFVTSFAPDPPRVRSAWDALDWSKIGQHARVIYKHRSKALHEGTPFPLPMLRPEPTTDENGTPAEVPGGLNSGGAGGVWMADQYPMTLSMFEYITRGALLRWWRTLTP
jgi:hypothetical protein